MGKRVEAHSTGSLLLRSARAATLMLICLVLGGCSAEAIQPATEPAISSSNSAPADDRQSPRPAGAASDFGTRVPGTTPGPSATATVGEGLVAFSSGFGGGDIYVVRSGETARRVLGADG